MADTPIGQPAPLPQDNYVRHPGRELTLLEPGDVGPLPADGGTFDAIRRSASSAWNTSMADFDNVIGNLFSPEPPLDPVEFRKMVGPRQMTWTEGLDRDALEHSLRAYDQNAMSAELEAAGVDRTVAQFVGALAGSTGTPQGAFSLLIGGIGSRLLAGVAGVGAEGVSLVGNIGRLAKVEAGIGVIDVAAQAGFQQAAGIRNYTADDMLMDLAITGLAVPFGAAMGVREARQATAAANLAERQAAARIRQAEQQAADAALRAERQAQLDAQAADMKSKANASTALERNRWTQIDIRRRRSDGAQALTATDRNALKKIDAELKRTPTDTPEGALKHAELLKKRNDTWFKVIEKAEASKAKADAKAKTKAELDAQRAADRQLADLEAAADTLGKKLDKIAARVAKAVDREAKARNAAEAMNLARQAAVDEWARAEDQIAQMAYGPELIRLQAAMRLEGLEVSLQQLEQMMVAAGDKNVDVILRQYAKSTVRQRSKAKAGPKVSREGVESWGKRKYDIELGTKDARRTVNLAFDDPVEALMYAAARGEQGAMDSLQRLIEAQGGAAPGSRVGRAMAAAASEAFLSKVNRAIRARGNTPFAEMRIPQIGGADDLIDAVTNYTSGVTPAPKPPIDNLAGVSDMSSYAQMQMLDEISKEIDAMPAEMKASTRMVYDELLDVAADIEKTLDSNVCRLT